MLRLFLGIEVIEVSIELIKAVIGRQHLVTVAKMVLAELPGDIAPRFEERGNRGVFGPHALRGAGQADLGQAGTNR